MNTKPGFEKIKKRFQTSKRGREGEEPDKGPEIEGSETAASKTNSTSLRNDAEGSSEGFEFLTKTATEFLDYLPEQDNYQLIGKRLAEIVGNAIVIVNSYDQQVNQFRTRFLEGLGTYTENIINLLNRHPVGMTFELNDSEAMKALRTGKMQKGPEGLYELSFKAIPKGVCRAIEKVLNIGTIYAIGFVHGGKLFGDVIIITRQGKNDRLVAKKSRLIEIFINQAAIALQRNLFEDALAQSEKKYRDLFQNGSDLMCVHDLEGNLLETNLKYKEEYGLTGEDLSDVNIRNFIAGKYKPEFDEYLERILQNGEDEGHLRVALKSGDEVVLEYKNKLIHDSAGKPVAVQGSARDITSRIKAAKAQEESEKKYRLLFENANDAIFITQDGSIKFPNPSACELLGCSEDELDSISFADLIHPEDREKIVEAYRRKMEDRSDVTSTYSHRLINKAGDEIVVNTNVVRIEWEGRPAGLNFVRDITRQQRLETQLRQSQKMETTGTLAGGIAHEFNNILGIIVGNTELALDNVPKGNPATGNLEEVLSASLRAKEVVRQILTYVRKMPTDRKPIRMSGIITESLKMIRATIPTSIGIRQEVLCESEKILADPTEIKQAFINLSTNAIHAMEDGTGVLEVRLEVVHLDENAMVFYEGLKPGDHVKLTVRDTGKGIAPKIMDRIFDPYFTTKDIDKGVGMGLAVVYGIVKKHDGDINVASVVGKGTRVEVLFPIVETPFQAEPAEWNRLPTGTERILFVDDEASLVEIAKHMLERLGYQVVGKTDSVEALELFRSEPDRFDLVITDMAMPQMPGDRLVQELNKIRSGIPIILCTGHSDRIDEDRAQELGIMSYTMKPLNRNTLASTVRKVLDEANAATQQ